MAFQYPLEQVLDVKKKRVEDAERHVMEMRKALEREQDKLKEREKERDRVKQHYQDKLDQFREEISHETTTRKIQNLKNYLKVAKENVTIEEKKVRDQQEQVELAEKKLEEAQKALELRRREVDKLETHKEDWLVEQRKEEEIMMGREQDELGSVMHLVRKRQQ
ncbi:MAG: YscO family type III secretion system apparatus protein [Chlamydiia bacterium]|nr:YscO family type III secretion system apparatus protein [Chlamydiia bacterium]